MSTVAEKIQILRQKNAHVNFGGGREKLGAQHAAAIGIIGGADRRFWA